MNSGQKITGELVISRGDAPEVLEPAKAAFDDISSFVGAFVEAMDDDTVRFIGDYGLGATTNDCAAKLVAIIPLARSTLMGGASARTSGAAAISASWPGVRCRTTGRQSGSLSAWIFVVRPPRERPIA
ncbi:hypothetical protein BRDID11004_67350 [Bradyrhizobium diazoefficiens]|jgi:hypothetical protein|uniref:Uncharacterized protein n=2 Tax=Bradyrhizobium TaxID=374 RepID=A0A810CIU4_9BRAD|nr:Transposase [Bradyrhizobium diazoefficiens]APO50300.1 transposase [Bradyrhizobium diazoefficiens]APO50554.1 transposase [Bradyrhizobium diazoefficiens]BBZ92135.1 hypothetical protein F07S3_19680 [Bradyrhizobium diazoefficiens]BCE19339.1 hypothetical protein XF1B_20200 [Bradyrhizobium diazoefficiens]